MSAATAGENAQHKSFVAMIPNVEQYLRVYPRFQHLPRVLHMIRAMNDKNPLNLPRLQELTNIAVDLFKEGWNTGAYKDFCQRTFQRGVVNVSYDEHWAARRDKEFSAELEKRQVSLGTATNSLDKEGMRVALNELALFYAARGDAQNSTKCIHRSRENCQTNEHLAEMCSVAVTTNLFRIINASAAPGISSFKSFADRGMQLAETNDIDPFYFAFFKTTLALAEFDKGNFKGCAINLQNMRLSPKTQVDFQKVAANFFNESDLVLLLVLCALASYDRQELDKLLATPHVKLWLEDEPLIRSLATNFFECEYAKALVALDELSLRVRVDYFASARSHTLLQTIRHSALKQYVYPFQTLDLAKMAKSLNTPKADLEQELAQLIVKGLIKCRIDKTNGVLRATYSDSRVAIVGKVLEVGAAFEEEARDMIRLLSMQRNDVAVVQSRRAMQPMQPFPPDGHR